MSATFTQLDVSGDMSIYMDIKTSASKVRADRVGAYLVCMSERERKALSGVTRETPE